LDEGSVVSVDFMNTKKLGGSEATLVVNSWGGHRLQVVLNQGGNVGGVPTVVTKIKRWAPKKRLTKKKVADPP